MGAKGSLGILLLDEGRRSFEGGVWGKACEAEFLAVGGILLRDLS